GRTTLGPDFGEFWGPLTHEHVLTRTVRDSAGVLNAVSGPGPGDPYAASPPARPYTGEVGADPGRLRIRVRTTRTDGAESHPECVAAVEATVRLLEQFGHDVSPARVEALETPDIGFLGIYASAITRDLERWGTRIGRTLEPSDLDPINALNVELGRARRRGRLVGAGARVRRGGPRRPRPPPTPAPAPGGGRPPPTRRGGVAPLPPGGEPPTLPVFVQQPGPPRDPAPPPRAAGGLP